MTIATSSMRKTFLKKTKPHAELYSKIPIVVTGDDPAVKHAKPAPDIYLEAARRLGHDPKDCFAFEDSPNGVRAALAAGMRVVWIPDPQHDFSVEHSDLDYHPNVIKLKSLWEVPGMPLINLL